MKPQDLWKSSLLGILSLFLAASSITRSLAGDSRETAVFAAPSAEMVDVSHGLGIPLGGIGTGFSVFGKYGFVDVYFDGRPLNGRDWQVDRPPTEKPSYAFQLTEGGKSTVLQETPVDWLAGCSAG